MLLLAVRLNLINHVLALFHDKFIIKGCEYEETKIKEDEEK